MTSVQAMCIEFGAFIAGIEAGDHFDTRWKPRRWFVLTSKRKKRKLRPKILRRTEKAYSTVMAAPRLARATQMIDADGRHVNINPILYQRACSFEPQDGDIIEMTFLRSGSHWAQQIIQLILESGESAKTLEEFTKRAPFLEMTELESTKVPRLIRTHLPLGKIKFNGKAKYVYVARNPWDCCVSYCKLRREVNAYKNSEQTFDDLLGNFLRGKIADAGDYFDHVMAAFDLRGEPNVFFVTYEELHEHKADVVLRLAYFLGEQYGRCLRENQGVFRLVMERSTLSFMKEFLKPNPGRLRAMFGKNTGHVTSSCSTDNFQSNDVINIVREGAVGNWKKHFSPDNIEAMKAYMKAKTTGSEVMNLWKEREI